MFSHAQGNVFGSSAIAKHPTGHDSQRMAEQGRLAFRHQQSLKEALLPRCLWARGKHFLGNSHGIVNAILAIGLSTGRWRVSSGVPINIGNVQLVG